MKSIGSFLLVLMCSMGISNSYATFVNDPCEIIVNVSVEEIENLSEDEYISLLFKKIEAVKVSSCSEEIDDCIITLSSKGRDDSLKVSASITATGPCDEVEKEIVVAFVDLRKKLSGSK